MSQNLDPDTLRACAKLCESHGVAFDWAAKQYVLYPYPSDGAKNHSGQAYARAILALLPEGEKP